MTTTEPGQMIETVKQLSTALENFQCADTHTRDQHIAKLQYLELGLKKGNISSQTEELIRDARKWLIRTTVEKLLHEGRSD